MGTTTTNMPPPFTAGTVTGAANQAVLTGTGTGWTTSDGNGNTVGQVFPGDLLILPGVQFPNPILSVDSATQITLEIPLPAAVSGASYRIRRYAPQPQGAVLGALQTVLGMGSDTNPDLARTFDGGSGRLKIRNLNAGGMELAAGATNAANAQLVSAIQISAAGVVTLPQGLANPLAVTQGGTGAATAAAAAHALGLGTADTPTFANLNLTNALPIAEGGTGATSASGAAHALGLGSGDTPTFDAIVLARNGAGTNIKIGDDCYVGDANLSNGFAIVGQVDPTKGAIGFGTGSVLYSGGGSSDTHVYSDKSMGTHATLWAGDIHAGRADNTGYVYFGSNSKYLTWNGGGFQLSGGNAYFSDFLTVGNGGSGGNLTVCGDVTLYRTGAPSTGCLYFSNSTSHAIFFDGSNFNLNGGNLNVSGTYYGSDHRLKQNYTPLDKALALSAIQDAIIYQGEFIAAPGTLRHYVLAHELATTRIPGVVQGTLDEVDAEGQPLYQRVDYTAIVPTLMAAVQALAARVAALEKPAA